MFDLLVICCLYVFLKTAPGDSALTGAAPRRQEPLKGH